MKKLATITLALIFTSIFLAGCSPEARKAKHYRKAAEQGFAQAQYELGNCYLLGKGVEQSETEAVKWLTKAAEQGNTDAMSLLGGLYIKYKNPAEPILDRIWTEFGAYAYKTRNTNPYKNLRHYNIKENIPEGKMWLTKAAELGNPNAMLKLSFICRRELQLEDGKKWLKKAAELDNIDAMFVLGLRYIVGKNYNVGAKYNLEDIDEGIRLIKIVAEQGNVDAMGILGTLYLIGGDIHYGKALISSYFHGSELLCYAMGCYPPRIDRAEATIWLKKASERGHEEAKLILTRMNIENYEYVITEK